MSMYYKLGAVAGTTAVAEEILQAVSQIFGSVFKGTPYAFGSKIVAGNEDLFLTSK